MPKHPDSPVRIRFHEDVQHGACIKVISVGGGGNSAINRMIDMGMDGVDFISVNTDLQSLQSSRARVRLHLGARLTHGLGTGSNPEIGRQAALEGSDQIIEALEGADMVFITAGLGGGTGTGAAPVIASIASQMGALTVAIVTRPFAFEGKRRMKQAEQGLQELLDQVDTLIVVHNDRLLAAARDTGFFDAFRITDDVLRQAVQGISDIITIPGLINRDFADVRMTMAGMGYAVVGTEFRTGPRRAADAALAAITSPLLEAGAIDGARGILINITGSSSLKLSEVNEASTIIKTAAHEDANIIFGAVLDERLGDAIKITVIATGFHQESRDRAERRLLPPNGAEKPAASFVKKSQRAVVTSTSAVDDIPLQKPHDIYSQNSAPPNRSPFPSATTPEPPDTSPSVSPSIAYEEALLANLEGPPFDTTFAMDEAAPAQLADMPSPPEVARIRQAAVAAYSAMPLPETEIEVPSVLEPGSFAEILENRRILSVDQARPDDLIEEEKLPPLQQAAPANAHPPAPPSESIPMVTDSPAAHNAEIKNAKGPTADFNRKLNRKPDFSLGVEVI